MTAEQREAARKQRNDLAAKNRDEDLRKLLSMPEGRRVLWRLVDQTSGAFGPSFHAEHALSTAYREGQRSVGLALMSEAQRVDAQLWLQVLADAATERLCETELRRKEES